MGIFERKPKGPVGPQMKALAEKLGALTKEEEQLLKDEGTLTARIKHLEAEILAIDNAILAEKERAKAALKANNNAAFDACARVIANLENKKDIYIANELKILRVKILRIAAIKAKTATAKNIERYIKENKGYA